MVVISIDKIFGNWLLSDCSVKVLHKQDNGIMSDQ